MENGDIEKLKEAAFKLAEIARLADKGLVLVPDEWIAAIAAVEAFKPKPEPIEAWVIVWADGSRTTCTSKPSEKLISGRVRLVHLREVTPAPEWERWERHTVSNIYAKTGIFQDVADAHNAEMQRVTGTEGK